MIFVVGEIVYLGDKIELWWSAPLFRRRSRVASSTFRLFYLTICDCEIDEERCCQNYTQSLVLILITATRIMNEENITTADRLRGMIWGQFVGDAAALGSHWIYNLSELESTYPDGVHGFEVPKAGHYHEGKTAGDFTHYGDAAFLLLQSVAACGNFDVVHFGHRFMEIMAPGVYKGYIDHATRGTIENKQNFESTNPGKGFDYQQGADDDQLATASSLAPVIAAHFRDEALMVIVEKATRVRQNNNRAVAYMQMHARILLELIEGRDVHSALHRVEEHAAKNTEFGVELKRKLLSAFNALSKSVQDATLELGQSCPLISSFPSALHSLLKESESFKESILAILRAGGDNAGRAAMAGAWLGAHLGVKAITKNWCRQLKYYGPIHEYVEKIIAAA